jgi:hypothetical protein
VLNACSPLYGLSPGDLVSQRKGPALELPRNLPAAPAVAPLLPSGISTALILATSYVEIYRKGLGRKEVFVTGDISSWALEYFKRVLFIIVKINPRELIVTNKKTQKIL